MPRLRSTPCVIQTFLAAEVLAAHRLVIFSATDGNVEYPAGAGDTQHAGVTMHEATAIGQMVDVCMLGPCILTVDGNASNIAVGDFLESHNATGYGSKVTLTDGTTAHEIVARAMQASTADDEEISVFVNVMPAFLA